MLLEWMRGRSWARGVALAKEPLASVHATGEYQDYCTLARGLAPVLAQCAPRALHRRFPATLQAYRALCVQLQHSRQVWLPPQLLIELSHEIVSYADPQTREAARSCLARSAAAVRARRAAESWGMRLDVVLP